MKNFKKLLCLLLALVTVMSCFVACGEDTSSGNGTTVAQGGENTTSPQQSATTAPSGDSIVPEKVVWFDMYADDGTPCYIVYPKDASQELIDKANKTSDKINAIVKGKAPVVISENDLVQYKGNFIYVGNVGVAQTSDLLSKLKYCDLGFAVYSEDALCVAGHSDDLTVDALSNFWKYLSSVTIAKEKTLEDGTKVTGGRYFSSANNNIKPDTYKVSSVTVEGKSLSEYSIVYASSKEKDEAFAIREAVGVLSGIVLSVTDQSAAERTNEILIGNTNRAASKKHYGTTATLANDKFIVEIADGKIVLAGPNNVMCELAADYVVNTVFNSKTASETIELKAADTYVGGTTAENFDLVAKDSGDIRILSSNMYFEDHTRERLNAYLEILPVYDADIICLQEMDQNWHLLLDNELVKYGYTVVPTRGTGKYATVTNSQNYTPIHYRADKYNLIDYGYVPYSSVTDNKTEIFKKYSELASLTAAQKERVLKEYIKEGKEYQLVAHMSKTFTWAVFESKTTGEKFSVISTHLTHDNGATVANIRRKYDAKELAAKILEIQAQYNVPVVSLGDYNCSIGSDPYKELLNVGLTDAMNSSAVREVGNSSHVLGEYPKTGGYPIDLAFYTEGINSNKYQHVANDYTVAYSDHLPLVYDFSIAKAK